MFVNSANMANNDEIQAFEEKIRSYLGISESDLSFKYESIGDGIIQLDLITCNPRHKESFLFHRTKGIDDLSALKRMYDYVKSYKSQEYTYTVNWAIIGTSDFHTSYFRAKNIFEVLDKLYYEKEVSKVQIYSITLNPIA